MSSRPETQFVLSRVVIDLTGPQPCTIDGHVTTWAGKRH
jgi:hypothetical protein